MTDTTERATQAMHLDNGNRPIEMYPWGESMEFAVNVGWAEAHEHNARYCGVVLVRSDLEAVTFTDNDLDKVRAEVRQLSERTGCWWLILDTQWNDMPNNGAIIELETIQVWRK